jgi:hypothetical protein
MNLEISPINASRELIKNQMENAAAGIILISIIYN